MFDLIQERDVGSELAPRTIFYILTHGEVEKENQDELSERGQGQVMELAHSRIVPGVTRIYSSPGKVALQTAGILRKVFETSVDVRDCLEDVKLGKGKMKIQELAEVLSLFWDDPDADIKHGESLNELKHRFGDCLNNIASRHPNDSVVIVTHPMNSALLISLVMGGPVQVEDWLNMGHCSCASYEYSRKSWTLVMPPDDSFLTDPVTVVDSLPEDIREKFGV
ncbi:MAG: histidine phosphatase family protein [Candidatus Thorarchaeota archaeon]